MPSNSTPSRRPSPARAPRQRSRRGRRRRLLAPPPGMRLAVSSTCWWPAPPSSPTPARRWAGRRSRSNDLRPRRHGRRARWAFLALALPQADRAWIAAFARGFFTPPTFRDRPRRRRHHARTADAFPSDHRRRGPGPARDRRGGARAGDDLWISRPASRAASGSRRCGRNRPGRHPPRQFVNALQPAAAARVSGSAAAQPGERDAGRLQPRLLSDLRHLLDAPGTGAIVESRRCRSPRSPPAAPSRCAGAACSRAETTTGFAVRGCFDAVPRSMPCRPARPPCIASADSPQQRLLHLREGRRRLATPAACGYDHFAWASPARLSKRPAAPTAAC